MSVFRTDYNTNTVYVSNLIAAVDDLSLTPHTITANATLTDEYPVIEANVTGGAITFTLATLAGLPNQAIYIRRYDPTSTGNALTIVPQTGYTIFGDVNYVMTNNNQVVLIYRDPTALDWRNLSPIQFVSSAPNTIPLYTSAVSVSAGPTTVAYFPWTFATYSGYTSLVFSAWVVPAAAGKDLTISLLENGGASIGSVTVTGGSASGIYSFTFTAPVANTRLDVQVSRTGAAGGDPVVYGMALDLS